MTKASYEAFRIMQEKSANNKNPYWKITIKTLNGE